MTGVRKGRAKLLLRTAALVATLQGVAHLALFLRSQPHPGSAVWPLAELMKHQIVGPTNMWAMYYGYGLRDTVGELVIAALIMLASSFDDGSRILARRLVLILIVGCATYAALGALYFFHLPLLFYAILLPLLAAAWMSLGKSDVRR